MDLKIYLLNVKNVMQEVYKGIGLFDVRTPPKITTRHFAKQTFQIPLGISSRISNDWISLESF